MWKAVINCAAFPRRISGFNATASRNACFVPERSCKDSDDTLTLRSRVSGHGVKIDFPGFKYIGIWSAEGDAPFVALEPWTGHATLDTEDNVFEHKRNITILAPGEVDERSFTVTLL